MEKKSRLGRGLDALLSGDDGQAAANTQSQVSVEAIEQSPFQPRKGFDDDELSALRRQHQNPRHLTAVGSATGRRASNSSPASDDCERRGPPDWTRCR